MWDIDSYDWLYKDEEIVYKNIINNIKYVNMMISF